MSQSAIAAALAAHDHEALRASIYSEMSPTIPADVDPQTWDERELGALGGNCWPKVTWQEREWYRDGDDSDTDHDGLTTIVTLGGSRYKTNDVRFDPRSVISRSLDTPPEEDGSPPLQYGETWLVPEGASGDWASHEDERAMWTARGWKFKPPAHGEITLVEDEGEAGQFIHFNVNDEWDDGLPGNVVDLSVRPSHLLIRSWAFENQTTTVPPATGPAGEQYVIGAGASGAWAGHDKKIAWRPASDAPFVITQPFIGERGRDKDLGIDVRWTGTAWESAVGVWVGFGDQFTESGNLGGVINASPYSYSAGTPPTTSSTLVYDNSTLTFKAKRAGAKLRFHYSAHDLTFGSISGAVTTNGITLAFFRGSEANAFKHFRILPNTGPANDFERCVQRTFVSEALDDQPTTYKVAVLPGYDGTNRYSLTAAANRLFTVEELGD